MTPRPLVSIVIPCRNEERFIGMCLDSVLGNDYPRDRLEVLIVDGMSDDGTREIVREYVASYPFMQLVENPKRIAPSAMNAGIRLARGSVLMRMDAHNVYPVNYISGLVRWLEESGADNVGGIWVTRPACGTPKARAIAIGLSHPFGVGNAYFRIGAAEPRWVDTVPFGCYRREVFERIGMFDEELVRNQDDEFNLRLIKAGGRILLVPEISSEYYARESLTKLWRMYYQYGYYKPLVVRKVNAVLTARQLVPAAFVATVASAAALAPWSAAAAAALGVVTLAYAAATVVSAAPTVRREGLQAGLALLVVFPVLHSSYGLGSLRGALDFLVLRRRSLPDPAAIPTTR